MRTVTYGAACSLDGFIAGTDGGLDWLHFSKDVQAVLGAYWKTIDVIVMGRKTWTQGLAQGGGGGASSNKMKTYVFSRNLKEIAAPGVQLVKSDPGEFVRSSRSRKGRGSA